MKVLNRVKREHQIVFITIGGLFVYWIIKQLPSKLSALVYAAPTLLILRLFKFYWDKTPKKEISTFIKNIIPVYCITFISVIALYYLLNQDSYDTLQSIIIFIALWLILGMLFHIMW